MDSVREGEGGKIWENGIETCKISCMKRVANPGSMHDTGVGCHFLIQCIKMKSEREAAQSCPTPSDPMDCSLPGSSVHGFSRQEY